MTEEADFPEPVEVIDPNREKKNAERAARILWLGQAISGGDPAGKAALERMPDSGVLMWHDRKAGDPWPADAPWSVNDDWAKEALHREERTGDTLGLCCDRTMIRWLAEGDARPLAAWMLVMVAEADMARHKAREYRIDLAILATLSAPVSPGTTFRPELNSARNDVPQSPEPNSPAPGTTFRPLGNHVPPIHQ